MLSGLLSIGQLLPIALIVVIVVCVFESCWRKCPPDKLMIVSGAGKMRSVSGKGTTTIVDQVASGLKDSTGVDLPSLLSGLLAKSDMDAGAAESLAD